MMPSARLNVFSIVFGVAYMGMFFWSERYHTALFRYYPVSSPFTREDLPLEEAGPAILWYSWLFGAGGDQRRRRRWWCRGRCAERIGQAWVWGVPTASLVVILVYERQVVLLSR